MVQYVNLIRPVGSQYTDLYKQSEFRQIKKQDLAVFRHADIPFNPCFRIGGIFYVLGKKLNHAVRYEQRI